MFARPAAALALMLVGCAASTPSPPPPPPPAIRTPLTLPPPVTDLAAACGARDGWSDPAPPVRISGDIYYVGTCGITALLISSPAGHILIDGATAQAAPEIAANIRRLGFSPRDVRYILTSHEHIDHVGGVAALKELTGAQVVARAEARTALESGRAGAEDPQAGGLDDFPGVRVDRLITDGEVLRLGTLALTAHATPAHTPGSTSWSWRQCGGGDCRTIVYADSLTAVSARGYSFSDHPRYVARFRETLERVARMECDILITPHPGASNLFERIAGRAPLVNANACRDYAAAARRRLDARLAEERAR